MLHRPSVYLFMTVSIKLATSKCTTNCLYVTSCIYTICATDLSFFYSYFSINKDILVYGCIPTLMYHTKQSVFSSQFCDWFKTFKINMLVERLLVDDYIYIYFINSQRKIRRIFQICRLFYIFKSTAIPKMSLLSINSSVLGI